MVTSIEDIIYSISEIQTVGEQTNGIEDTIQHKFFLYYYIPVDQHT